MIYETKNHCLIKDTGEIIKLTDLEHKFLIAISDEERTLIKVIAEYVFGSSDERFIRKVKGIKRRLTKLMQFKRMQRKNYITGLPDVSYKLETEIYFK